MTRWLALLAFLLLPSLAHAQTVTAKFSLNNTAWTDLGPGPLMLGINGIGVYAIGDAAPTVTREGLNIVSGEAGPVFSASHVWAMMKDAPSGIAFVAPIVPGAGGGGGGGCSQATAYLARATGETTHPADLTTLICGLVADGVWAKLDALYVFAQQNETDAKLNLIGTSYPATQQGSFQGAVIAPRTGTIIFTPYKGFSGFNTAGSFLTTGFNPNSAPSPQFTRNSANLGAWLYAVINEPASVIGTGNAGAGDSNLYPNVSGTFYARVNNGTGVSTSTTVTKGLLVGDRPDSATIFPYQNGSSSGGQASTSAAPANAVISIGTNTADYTSAILSEAHIGASLGSAGNLALYNRLRTYMTAVGVP